MNVSFVICTKSVPSSHSDAFVTQLRPIMRPGDELIVIENISNAARFSQVRLHELLPAKNNVSYIALTSGTLGRSRNIAFRIAKKDVLIFVDDDVIVHPKLRERAVAFLSRNSAAVIYVNPFRPAVNNAWSIVSCAYWNQALIFRRKLCKIRGYPLACSAFKMSFIKKHRITCNDTIFTSEDMDLLLTINERGGIVYFDPKLTHTHKFATTMTTFIRKHYWYAFNYKDLQNLHPATFRYFDNAYNYMSEKNYGFPFNYLGSIKRIFFRTSEFMRTNRLPLYYLPHVILLMIALTAGVFAGKNR